MNDLARSMAKLVAVISVKTGDDGKMFGSVTAGSIADQLKTQFDVSLDKRKIHLEQPIRALGEHEVELRLHHDVVAKLKVRVESSNPLPEVAPVNDKTDGPHTEKRGRRSDAAGDKADAGKPARADKRPRKE